MIVMVRRLALHAYSRESCFLLCLQNPQMDKVFSTELQTLYIFFFHNIHSLLIINLQHSLKKQGKIIHVDLVVSKLAC